MTVRFLIIIISNGDIMTVWVKRSIRKSKKVRLSQKMPSIYCNAAFKIMKRQHICHNMMILRLTDMVFFMVDANNNYHSPLSWRLKTDI